MVGLVSRLDAQSHDLCISYQNYSVGVPVANDTIRFNFTVKNAGNTTLPSGTVVNLGVDIGGTAYDLDLLGPPATGITLSQDLMPGDSFNLSKGYLLGSGTLLYLGLTEVDFCLIVYGTGADPVNTTFPNDAEPANNIDCVRFTAGTITLQSRAAQCVVEAPTTAKREAQPLSFSCYPNPAGSAIHLHNPVSVMGTLTLSNPFGQQVYTAVVAPGDSKLAIAHLPRGVYLAEVVLDGEAIVHFRLLLQ
jgi:hypothetical protein